MQRAWIAAVLLVVLFSPTLAGAASEKVTVASTRPGAIVTVLAGNTPVWDYETRLGDWLKNLPVAEGINLRIRPCNVPSDVSKGVLTFVAVGDECEQHVVRSLPAEGICIPTATSVTPVIIYTVMKEGYRKDTSWLRSQDNFLFRILASIPILGDLGKGKVVADVKESFGFSFQGIVYDKPRSVVTLARWMARKGTAGAAAFDLDPTESELEWARRMEEQVEAIKAENEARGLRNSAKLAEYEAKLAEYRAELAEWEALPRTKTVSGTPGKVVIRRAVIRFREGESLAVSYCGPYQIDLVLRDQTGQVTGYQKATSGIANRGQQIIGWWQAGAEVVVRYGAGCQCKTVPFVLNDDGTIEVCWAAAVRRHDAQRKAISHGYILTKLASGRRAGIDAVLRLVGTSACEVETAIRVGSYEIRPVCPGESFILANGSPPSTSNWSPSKESPAVWVTLPDGRAVALQFLEGCDNFMAARYIPEPALLQPEICRTEAVADSVAPFELPGKPCPPRKPRYEELLKLPVMPALLPTIPCSSYQGVYAQGRVDRPSLPDYQIWWFSIHNVTRQILPPDSPFCPTGPGNGSGTPPLAGWVFDFTLQPPSANDGQYNTGGGNTSAGKGGRISGWPTRPGSQ